jgi:hypothetical protein
MIHGTPRGTSEKTPWDGTLGIIPGDTVSLFKCYILPGHRPGGSSWGIIPSRNQVFLGLSPRTAYSKLNPSRKMIPKWTQHRPQNSWGVQIQVVFDAGSESVFGIGWVIS